MTANAFMAGSLDPMLCVVSINHTAQMHARLRAAGHFGVSFLSQEQQHLAAHFAGKRLERLVPDFELRGRTPILQRAVAAVTADVVDTAELRRSHVVHRQHHELETWEKRRGRCCSMAAATHDSTRATLAVPKGAPLDDVEPPRVLVGAPASDASRAYR